MLLFLSDELIQYIKKILPFLNENILIVYSLKGNPHNTVVPPNSRLIGSS